MKYHTKSPKETGGIAAKVAKKIVRQGTDGKAAVIGLTGDLGSGKTTFVQGFARALGIRRRVVSPTFTIMRRYALPKTSSAYRRGFRSLVHVDAYRVHKPKELKVIKFASWLQDPAAIVLIEWADLVGKKLLRDARIIHFAHGAGGSRIISFKSK